jgi:hypothetical protein
MPPTNTILDVYFVLFCFSFFSFSSAIFSLEYPQSFGSDRLRETNFRFIYAR